MVARGAALHAGIVAARSDEVRLWPWPTTCANRLAQVVEINVNSHSLGIEVKRGEERFNDILIPKNTQLPTAASRVYSHRGREPAAVRVKVLQGEAHQADACISHRRMLDRRAAAEPAQDIRRCRCVAASAATA